MFDFDFDLWKQYWMMMLMQKVKKEYKVGIKLIEQNKKVANILAILLMLYFAEKTVQRQVEVYRVTDR